MADKLKSGRFTFYCFIFGLPNPGAGGGDQYTHTSSASGIKLKSLCKGLKSTPSESFIYSHKYNFFSRISLPLAVLCFRPRLCLVYPQKFGYHIVGLLDPRLLTNTTYSIHHSYAHTKYSIHPCYTTSTHIHSHTEYSVQLLLPSLFLLLSTIITFFCPLCFHLSLWPQFFTFLCLLCFYPSMSTQVLSFRLACFHLSLCTLHLILPLFTF